MSMSEIVYRKKLPMIIPSMQYTGENEDDILSFIEDALGEGTSLWMDAKLAPGDWVIVSDGTALRVEEEWLSRYTKLAAEPVWADAARWFLVAGCLTLVLFVVLR